MLEGFLLINKPVGVSSFHCVARIRRIIRATHGKKYKVGHAGTLDPFATGLLVVALGRAATQHLGIFIHAEKKYRAYAKIGELTTTLDSTGIILNTLSAQHITHATLQTAINALGSHYEQIPPVYSAQKVGGRRLYALAAQGKKTTQELAHFAELKKRMVQLHALQLVDFKDGFFTLNAHVSHGTYIRSLVNDIAGQCANYATTYQLQRTAIGSISCEHAIDLETFNTQADVERALLDTDLFLATYQNTVNQTTPIIPQGDAQ